MASPEFYITVHHGGIRTLCHYTTTCQHKGMDISLYVVFIMSSILNFKTPLQGRGQKGVLRKRLRSARNYQAS